MGALVAFAQNPSAARSLSCARARLEREPRAPSRYAAIMLAAVASHQAPGQTGIFVVRTRQRIERMPQLREDTMRLLQDSKEIVERAEEAIAAGGEVGSKGQDSILRAEG